MHGQFTWYELTTPDVAAAKTFYPKLTGWGLESFDNDYTMFTAGAPVAGIYRLSDEMKGQGVPPNWMAYVAVDDVDAAASKAVSLGGAVMYGPTDVPGTGRFAVVRDPQGAVFGVYRASGPSVAWDGIPVLGRPSWHELMTTDRTQASAFYKALLGWDATGAMDMGGGAMYSMFGHGDMAYAGMYDRMPGMEGMSPFWLLYFHVKDVAKASAAALKAGGQVIRPRMPIPGGTVAILSDPQGAAFAVHDLNAMSAAATPAPAAKAPAVAKPAAKKAVAKKAAPAKAAAGKAVVKKAAPPKAAAKKAASTKAAPKKAASKKAAVKKAAVKKAAPKKAAAKRVAPKKAAAKKAAAKKGGAKNKTAKSATPKRAAKKATRRAAPKSVRRKSAAKKVARRASTSRAVTRRRAAKPARRAVRGRGRRRS